MGVTIKQGSNGTGGGGGGQKQTLTSPNQTIDVQVTNTGHTVDVSSELLDTINNKQDKIIVSGMQTNALLSLSFLERNGEPSGIPRTLGHYIPLLEIQSYNIGKSQFEFSIFSREDSMNYYGRYLFTSWAGSSKFELIDYCNDNSNGVFNSQNIIAFKIYNSSNYTRYLICKKIISTSGILDAYFLNILNQDTGFCYSKKYYTRAKQTYYNDLECIKVNQNFTSWSWRYKDGCSSLQEESELSSTYDKTVDLTTLTEIKPTPSIIKPLTIDDVPFTGVEPRTIETRDQYATGVIGLTPPAEQYKGFQVDCTIYTGTEIQNYTWTNYAYLNFSNFDNTKCYIVYCFLKGGVTYPGYIIEIANSF